jgi:hypothetical protein
MMTFYIGPLQNLVIIRLLLPITWREPGQKQEWWRTEFNNVRGRCALEMPLGDQDSTEDEGEPLEAGS